MAEAPPRPSAVAVILAGAVTKGAFEAGVLQVIAERGIAVRRIVAASSGALNGTAYAAGVRARREREAAADLRDVWENHAGLCDVLHPNLGDIVRGRGLSDQDKLYGLLRDHVKPSTVPDPAPIDLHLITAPLRGVPGSGTRAPATTYTQVLGFAGESFDSTGPARRGAPRGHRLGGAPAALRARRPARPRALRGRRHRGEHAHPLRLRRRRRRLNRRDPRRGGDARVPRPFASQATPGARFAHVIDMVFSEWLFQDLRRSHGMNDRLRALEALARRKGWSPEETREVRAALGWERRRVMPIVSIRPVVPLPGTLLSGFRDAGVRRAYVATGVERARAVLDGLGWR